MKRTNCSACGYDDLRTFLDLGPSPIADAYTDTPWGSTDAYPLQVATCSGCHLAQLLEVVDQKTLFGTGYSFYSSASPPLSQYHERYAQDVLRQHPELVRRGVVEIGCNDGDMLRHFRGETGTGYVIGVDPSGGPVEMALDRGLGVINEPFTSVTAENIKSDYGPAGVVIANHVLAHVESVSEVVHGISELLAPDGIAYLEVQYLADLLTNNAFDLVYHEHRNFFSLDSLVRAAARWNLAVVDARLTDRQGGSLRVKLRHKAQARVNPVVAHILGQESWLQSPDAFRGVQGRAQRICVRLLETVYGERDAGRSVALYGAPAKATTLLNFCGLDADNLIFAVDSTPAKQDRYVPGTGVRILAPDDESAASVDTFLLGAWNYAGTIMRNHEAQHGRRRWIVPIPAPVVL